MHGERASQSARAPPARSLSALDHRVHDWDGARCYVCVSYQQCTADGTAPTDETKPFLSLSLSLHPATRLVANPRSPRRGTSKALAIAEQQATHDFG